MSITGRKDQYITYAEISRNEGGKYGYQIGFLDFTLFPEHPGFYSTYKLEEISEHYLLTDKLSIGVIDLTNINLATDEDKRYNTNKWAKLFKAQTWEEIKMLAVQDNSIDAAAETIYQLSEDERIRQECEAREDYLKRELGMKTMIDDQRKEINELQMEVAR